ncbi:MAG TPA: GNAT family N-acetyltransferase [Anaerolineales bacterium]|nr:GNAT family N-acetyltransferase [Anaerolineales bacterium]
MVENIKILGYDDVDPLQALNLNLIALDFALTPERAAQIRRTDLRPFPCFTINAVKDNVVVGQVEVSRLPMVSSEGREDVGGVWAVSTLPQHAGYAIASTLLEEAHNRMRDAGLRFSTLRTNRSHISYRLYKRYGYVDMNIWATGLARWETAHQPTRLQSVSVGSSEYDLVKRVFVNVAGDYLGFAWRHTPFAHFRDELRTEDIRILCENNRPIGYALASVNQSILFVCDLVLRMGVNPAEAIAALASQVRTAYVQVKINRPVEIASLRQAGYQVTHPDWSAFMLKPLIPKVTVEDARRLFGIDTDRFLISWLDTT